MAKNKTKRKKSSRSSLIHSFEKVIPGFWMSYTLADPLGDHNKPCKVKVGHSNPVMMIKLNRDDFWHAMRHVLHNRTLKWKMEIIMEFKKDGKSEFKSREIVGISRLPELDDHYQSTIESMFDDAVNKNYIDDYIETKVVQRVISGNTIKDDDFSD